MEKLIIILAVLSTVSNIIDAVQSHRAFDYLMAAAWLSVAVIYLMRYFKQRKGKEN